MKQTDTIKPDTEKIKEMEAFLKEAFCISGECKFKSFATIINNKEEEVVDSNSMLFELSDVNPFKTRTSVIKLKIKTNQSNQSL